MSTIQTVRVIHRVAGDLRGLVRWLSYWRLDASQLDVPNRRRGSQRNTQKRLLVIPGPLAILAAGFASRYGSG